MPVYTVASYEGTAKLTALVTELELRSESVVSVLDTEGNFVVVTNPPPARAAGRVEKRPAAKKQETR